MRKIFKIQTKLLSLFLCAALLVLPGCGDKSSGTVRSAEEVTEATTSTIAVIAERYDANIGEEVSLDDVTATLDHAYLSSYTFTDGDQDLEIIFYQITITNGSDESISANILSGTFYGLADGESYATVAVCSMHFITYQFGEDAECFNDNIEPGETRIGYVYIEMPAGFSEATLIYYPGAGLLDYTVAYSFTFNREELEDAPDPITPFETSTSDDSTSDTTEEEE